MLLIAISSRVAPAFGAASDGALRGLLQALAQVIDAQVHLGEHAPIRERDVRARVAGVVNGNNLRGVDQGFFGVSPGDHHDAQSQEISRIHSIKGPNGAAKPGAPPPHCRKAAAQAARPLVFDN